MSLYPQPGLYPRPGLYPSASLVTTPPAATVVTLTWPPSELYRQAVRAGAATYYTVNASLHGVAVAGAQDLRPTGGSVTDTVKPGVRRALSLDLASEPGLFDLLSPVGTRLSVAAMLRMTDRSFIKVPMGVFDVDSEKLSEGGGSLSLTAPDLWVLVQRARFPSPTSSTRGIKVTDQIVALLRGALGSVTVTVTATSTATVGALTWEKDRAQAIIDLAASIGAWVFFDRYGVPTIADVPTIGASANWLIDSSPAGVLISLDRERSRTTAYNLVVVESSASSGALFPTQFVWDNDPASPTYYGPGSGAGPVPPTLAGAFGPAPFFFDTPLPLSVGGAIAAGKTILSRVTGLASQVSLSSVINPAVDAFDTLDVLPPGQSQYVPGSAASVPGSDIFPGSSTYPGALSVPGRFYTTGRVLERHVVDTVTHPLTVSGAMTIDGRSTRTDTYISA